MSLEGKNCLIIGGGDIAYRKIKNLLLYPVRLTVIAPEVIKEIDELSGGKKITLYKRSFCDNDITGFDLVIAATNNPDVNHRIAEIAKEKKILVNVVDEPEYCSFIAPAAMRRGPLIIAVSTEGMCPALSKKIRDEIAKNYDEDYESYILILSKLRDIITTKIKDETNKKELLEKIIASEIFSILKNKGLESALDYGMTQINKFMSERKCI